MKLSKILEIESQGLEILDIVDVEMSNNSDVKRFIDIEKISKFHNMKYINEMLKNIQTIFERSDLNINNKIELITRENDVTKKMGLGYSKGKKNSNPRGPKKDLIEKMARLIIQISEENNYYKNIGLFKYSLKGVGRDSLSDIFSNTNQELIINESEKLIGKLKAKKFIKNGLIVKSFENKECIISYQGVDRFLTNYSWTIGDNEIENSEIISKINIYKNDDDFKKTIENSELRNAFQKVIEFSLDNEISIEIWKEFVDSWNIINNSIKVDVSKMENKIGEINGFSDIVKNLVSKSKKNPEKESVYSDLAKTLLNIKGIEYDAESETNQGNIDIFIPIWNQLIEIKIIKSKDDLRAAYEQIKIYKNSKEKYSKSNLLVWGIISKDKSEDLTNFIYEANINDIDFIFYKHNFETASVLAKKISQKKKSELSKKEQEEIENIKRNNKIIQIEKNNKKI